jgi:hypothetical protein
MGVMRTTEQQTKEHENAENYFYLLLADPKQDVHERRDFRGHGTVPHIRLRSLLWELGDRFCRNDLTDNTTRWQLRQRVRTMTNKGTKRCQQQ